MLTFLVDNLKTNLKFPTLYAPDIDVRRITWRWLRILTPNCNIYIHTRHTDFRKQTFYRRRNGFNQTKHLFPVYFGFLFTGVFVYPVSLGSVLVKVSFNVSVTDFCLPFFFLISFLALAVFACFLGVSVQRKHEIPYQNAIIPIMVPNMHRNTEKQKQCNQRHNAKKHNPSYHGASFLW